MRFQDAVEFKKDGKSKVVFMTAELRQRRRNSILRDENIRIMEERGMPELEDDQGQGVNLGFTASQIRKKLRRKNAKKQNR